MKYTSRCKILKIPTRPTIKYKYIEYDVYASVYLVEGRLRAVYGIEAENLNIYASDDYALVENISTNRAAVKALVPILKEAQVEPIHLQDVIEDMLGIDII